MVKRMTVWLTDEQYQLVEDYAKKNGITKHKAIKVLVDGVYHTHGSCKDANELIVVTKANPQEEIKIEPQ